MRSWLSAEGEDVTSPEMGKEGHIARRTPAPGSGKMGKAEPTDGGGVVLVPARGGPPGGVPGCGLRAPLDHAEGKDGPREGVSPVGRPDEWIHIGCRVRYDVGWLWFATCPRGRDTSHQADPDPNPARAPSEEGTWREG